MAPAHGNNTAGEGCNESLRIVLYQEREPCSDLGGFTRLLSTPGGMADGLVRETIPQAHIMSPSHCFISGVRALFRPGWFHTVALYPHRYGRRFGARDPYDPHQGAQPRTVRHVRPRIRGDE